MASEFERIARLKNIFGEGESGSGVGDDAAVVNANGRFVWTIDAQVENVHFKREWLSMRDIGYRAVMAAASDLAAMGAKPTGVLVALIAPTSLSESEFDELALGERDAADELGTSVIGGNLAGGEPLSLTTTCVGHCAAPVLRSGARAGDTIWCAGDLGVAAVGLKALMEGQSSNEAVSAWRRPRARIADGLAMRGVASAAIDVSDGLVQDAGHLAESSGVRLVIDVDALMRGAELLHESAKKAGFSARSAALFGGEDYALLATSPTPIKGFRQIGKVIEGAGVWLREGGEEGPVDITGFDHFRAS